MLYSRRDKVTTSEQLVSVICLANLYILLLINQS